jgi:pyridoxine kinase
MARILSIQSHVVYGLAGNAAAVFPMQRLGHQVYPLNLLQFSNHTGYGEWGGKAISDAELYDVLAGLKTLGIDKKLDCIITGYIGSEAQAQLIYEFIKDLKAENPKILYSCDPVMGDEHTGMYVKQEVADFMVGGLSSLADYISPNRFELSLLVGKAISNFDTVQEAAQQLLRRGTKLLATSASFKPGMTGVYFQPSADEGLHIETPEFTLAYTVRGTGDVTMASFMANYLSGMSYAQALEKTVNSMYEITKHTHDNKLTELGLFECQNSIVNPIREFKVRKVAAAVEAI